MYNYNARFFVHILNAERKIEMKKRISSLFMAAMLITFMAVNALAEETVIETSERVNYTLSLEDAIKMATEGNPQFESADTKIADAQRQLKQARKDQRNMKGAIRLPAGLANVAVKQGYYVSQYEIAEESAKREKKQAIDTLAYDVTQKYYGVKLSEALLQNAKNAYKVACDNKISMEKQYELGLVSKIDVHNANYTLNQAQSSCDSYERSLTLAQKSLAIALQIDDENYTLNLTDGIEYEEFTTDLNKDIENAMETRYDVYGLKSQYEQAEKYTHIAALLGTSSSQYSSANSAKVQSEYVYKNTKKLIALSINSSYNNILNAKDSLNLAQENLNLRQMEYDAAVIQHNLGMITNTQLTAIMNNVLAASTSLENAKLTYKLAVKKYGYDTTIGL